MKKLDQIMSENYDVKGEEKRRISKQPQSGDLFCITLKIDVEQVLSDMIRVSTALENEHSIMAMKWLTIARLKVESWLESNIREVE